MTGATSGASSGTNLIRFYLGVALFVRGILFLFDQEAALEMATAGGTDPLLIITLMHYVVPAHLLGGFLLAIGLLTWLSALIQVPNLLGSVFFVHFQEGLMATGQSLELTALTLFLLVIVAVVGPGKMSVEARFYPAEVAATG